MPWVMLSTYLLPPKCFTVISPCKRVGNGRCMWDGGWQGAGRCLYGCCPAFFMEWPPNRLRMAASSLSE